MEINLCSAKPDRKTVEKNRRMRMKLLCASLNSLLPSSKVGASLQLPELLDESVNYIKDLQKQIDEMKVKVSCLAGGMRSETGKITPHLVLRKVNGSVGAAIIATARDWSLFCKIIEVVQDEESEILSANVTVVGDKAFYIIHSLVGEEDSGSEMSMISEKLRKRIENII